MSFDEPGFAQGWIRVKSQIYNHFSPGDTAEVWEVQVAGYRNKSLFLLAGIKGGD